MWFESQGAPLTRLHDDLAALGYPVSLQTNPAALEPALRTNPPNALLFPTEGAVDAALLTRALLSASGARVLSHVPATRLLSQGGVITGAQTDAGPLHADHTILATGIGTPALLRTVGLDLPMVHRPGLILRTDPVPFRLRHILVTPHHEIRQRPDGSLLAPCAANHQTDTCEAVPDSALQTTLTHLTTLLGPVSVAETRLGLRPVPADGLPVLGQAAPGLSLAVMHSGVTLAPLAAEALVAELIDQQSQTEWAPYRPTR